MRTLRFVFVGLAVTVATVAFHARAASAQAQPTAQAGPGAQVLCLDATYRADAPQRRQSLLVREVVRQAVLVAAREDLGLATRDAVLRETFPAGARVLDVQITTSDAGEVEVVLIDRGAAAGAKPLWRRSFVAQGRYPDLLPMVVGMCDRPLFAEIAAALKGAGYAAAPKPAGAAAAVPEGVEERLLDLNLFPQFGVARQLHGALRAGGESPAALGGLARAYANLGQIAQVQWNAANQAFKARALLYAQRMIAAQPADAPEGLWHRAYAWTMAGGHAQALSDLAQAAARAKAKKVEPPPWVALIDAACRYDTSALLETFSQDRDAPASPLAAYLCFLTVENGRSVDALMKFGDAARQLNPSCLRVIDSMTESGGVAMQHRTTLEAPEVFKAAVFRDLPKVPNLPQPVRDAIATAQKQANVPKSRADIAAAVMQAGDASRDAAEPSWEVLGRAMEDTYFAQTHRRAYFLAFIWGVDQQEVAEYAAAAKALVGGHPYTPVLEAYGAWRNWPKALGLLKGVTFRDPNLGMYTLVHRVGTTPDLNVGPYTLWKLMLSNLDDTVADIERLIRLYHGHKTAYKTTLAQILHQVSPHSPVAIAVLIEDDWDASQPKVAQWQRDYGNHPVVASALARQYTTLGRTDEAKQMWETALAASPDVNGFRALAALHLKAGDEPQWLATMERALTAEDYGLSHARVRVDVAEHFMRKGDYRRALPYATAAAQTWAAWAMWCASHCYEGLGDWANAELWARRVAERYEDSAADWYVFCRRTGKGDEKAALRMARAYVQRFRDPASADAARFCGMIRLMAGEHAAAAKLFETGLAKFKDFDCGMLAALMHDAAGNAAARDAAWDALLAAEQTVEKPEEWRRFFELARLFKQQSGGAGSKDPAKIRAHLAATPDAPAKAFYWAGRFFRTRGNAAAAKTFLARCATTSAGMNRTLASAELRELGVEPRDLKAPPATNPTTTTATQPE